MDQVTSLSLARVAIGTGFIASPQLALKLGMLDPTAPQAAYLGRMFGAREVALGALTLMAKPEARTAVLLTGIAVDTSDAVAGALALRDKSVSTAAGAVLTGAAVAAVVTGVVSLLGARRA